MKLSFQINKIFIHCDGECGNYIGTCSDVMVKKLRRTLWAFWLISACFWMVTEERKCVGGIIVTNSLYSGGRKLTWNNFIKKYGIGKAPTRLLMPTLFSLSLSYLYL